MEQSFPIVRVGKHQQYRDLEIPSSPELLGKVYLLRLLHQPALCSPQKTPTSSQGVAQTVIFPFKYL